MSAESTLIFTGLLIAITPFLGLPSVWYGYIFAILGLVVFGIGLLLRTRGVSHTRDTVMHSTQETNSTHDNNSIHEPSPMA